MALIIFAIALLATMLVVAVGARASTYRARRDAHIRGLRAAQRVHDISSRAQQAMQAEAWRLKHWGK